MAAQITAAGVGLNLTAARQVVFNDLDWVPVNHWQAEDRAYRIGQQQAVNVTYMVGSGTVDEFVRAVVRVGQQPVQRGFQLGVRARGEPLLCRVGSGGSQRGLWRRGRSELLRRSDLL